MSRPIVVGGALLREGRLLAARRTAPAELAGRWELPGGKVEPGESAPEALVREFQEELGVVVRPVERVPGEWALPSGHVLHVWVAALVRGEPRALQDHDQLRWVTAHEALTLDWLPPDRPAVTWTTTHL
ncbi:(deoxy)nucleoside triphosphate pyrophosphohydrolase [Streptomyces sp. NBC_01190]|uniref:(deoxy)nucleoside triphosphate pyrophosphohydrolase n=1 Tax=Streptomyces sp. NBC_01190 TaxID=2903767 RepID=UPI00386DA2B6|nr:(deoxy)nucleoside triphosphate pyrophosphohydrolase [Streptomyces sp. NBC_01190]